MLRHRAFQQLQAVGSFRQFHPHEHAAGRFREGAAGRKLEGEGLQHGVAPAPVGRPQPFEMSLEVEVREQPGDGQHREPGTLQVPGLLDRREGVGQPRRAPHPSQAKRRRQDLREAAGVDHALVVERRERRLELPVAAQQAVGIVLEDDEVVVVREGHQPLAVLQPQTDSQRVVGVRNRVEQARALPRAQAPLERVDVEPAVQAARQGHRSGLVRRERLAEAGIDEALDRDRVADSEERAHGDVERLLGAAGDLDVLRPARRAPAVHEFRDAPGQLFACRSVLERPRVGQARAQRLGVGVRREQLDGRQAAGQGDHARPPYLVDQPAQQRALASP